MFRSIIWPGIKKGAPRGLLLLGLMAGTRLHSTNRCYFSTTSYAKGGTGLDGFCPTKSVLRNNVVVISGSGNLELSKQVCSFLGVTLADVKADHFKDNELHLLVNEDLTGKDIVLICSRTPLSNETALETLFLISTAKRNGARSITLVQPYAPFARADRMVDSYKCLAFADTCVMYEAAGVDRVITLDLHNPCALAAYSPKVTTENLTAVHMAADFIGKSNHDLRNVTVLTPDAGGLKRAKEFLDSYSTNSALHGDPLLGIMVKYRAKANEVAETHLLGDVAGRDCIIVDDMIDTGGTLMKSAEELKSSKARKVYAFASHGLFSGDFFVNLKDSKLDGVYVTDTLLPPNSEAEVGSKVIRIPAAKIIADRLYEIFGVDSQ